MDRRLFLSCLASTPLLAACSRRLNPVFYRLTVVVDTPQGPRSGTSYFASYLHVAPPFPGPEAGGIRGEETGEASAVALPNGGYLFALVKWPKKNGGAINYKMLAHAYPVELGPLWATKLKRGGHEQFADVVDAASKVRGRRRVRPEDYPVLAYLADPIKPAAVEIVDPANVAQFLGKGTRLRGIWVEVIDKPGPQTLENTLPWLKRNSGYPLDPSVEGKPVGDLPENKLLAHEHFAIGKVD